MTTLYAQSIFGQRAIEIAKQVKQTDVATEIGLVRTMIEVMLNLCDTPADVEMKSFKIGSLIDRLHKLISVADSIQKKDGTYLDKASIISLAGKLVDRLQDKVSPDVLQLIAKELGDGIIQM